MDRYDKIAAYSRIMGQVDALRDEEANEGSMDSFVFTKLDESYQALENARDRVERPV